MKKNKQEENMIDIQGKKTISEYANATSEPDIMKNLHSRDHFMRSEALESLEELGNKAYFEEVVKLLKDKNAMVRVDAIEALFYLGKEKSLSYLIEMLDHTGIYQPGFVKKNPEWLAELNEFGILTGPAVAKKFRDSFVKWKNDTCL
jgi:hypothetical protein